MKKASALLRALARWHRALGLVSAMFVVILALSGLLLHHSDRLGLDKKFVRSTGLLDWYGIAPPAEWRTYVAGDDLVTQIGERVYFDAREVLTTEAPLVGAERVGKLTAIAARERLWLLDEQGKLLDTLGHEHGLPAGIVQLGASGRQLVVRATSGDYRADPDALRWARTTRGPTRWAQAGEPPAELKSQIERDWRAHELTVEHVLRDVHSGRILGGAGAFVTDAAAVIMLVLAVSGLWLWWRARLEFGPARRERRARRN